MRTSRTRLRSQIPAAIFGALTLPLCRLQPSAARFSRLCSPHCAIPVPGLAGATPECQARQTHGFEFSLAEAKLCKSKSGCRHSIGNARARQAKSAPIFECRNYSAKLSISLRVKPVTAMILSTESPAFKRLLAISILPFSMPLSNAVFTPVVQSDKAISRI